MLRAMARSAIHYLKKRGLTDVAIAAQVGCERRTVARVRRQPIDQTYRRRVPPSRLAQWDETVTAWLDAGLPIKRMLELGESARRRLLQGNVLAGGDRGEGLLGVQVMRRQDLDRVEHRVREQVLEAIVWPHAPFRLRRARTAGSTSKTPATSPHGCSRHPITWRSAILPAPTNPTRIFRLTVMSVSAGGGEGTRDVRPALWSTGVPSRRSSPHRCETNPRDRTNYRTNPFSPTPAT